MTYFNSDFLDFFKELEQNNSKEWFDINRKRYERSVKNPFKRFVLALVDSLQEIYPDIDLSDKYSIMRINRDIRFSKDKTPYKTHVASMINPLGKKDKSRPGLYVQANHKDVRIYSGSHNLEKDQLECIRGYIKENINEFNSLISNKDFVNTFGEILGEKNKRIPPEFRVIEKVQPLIANKEFYWYFKLNSLELLQDSLLENLISKFKKALSVNNFFKKALDN